ncbi:hypothetical protein, partial [Burkholderia sp. BDU5]|uniref:hypothetical protein n=1 Tax=Burkholderia sp. BDU5 TaxID=1385590 RepID=UPI002F3E6EEA
MQVRRNLSGDVELPFQSRRHANIEEFAGKCGRYLGRDARGATRPDCMTAAVMHPMRRRSRCAPLRVQRKTARALAGAGHMDCRAMLGVRRGSDAFDRDRDALTDADAHRAQRIAAVRA